MTHPELVNYVLTIHAASILAIFAAYTKYGDRTERSAKSLQGVNDILTRMRQRVAGQLADELRPIFNSAESEPLIVSPHEYIEKAVNPIDSERYKEGIREFLERESTTLIDYRSLILARDSWRFWGKCLSWAILISLFWQLIVLAGLGVLDKVFEWAIPDSIIYMAVLISFIGIVCCLVPLPIIQKRHDAIDDFRISYDAP